MSQEPGTAPPQGWSRSWAKYVKSVTKRDLLMWLCLGQVTCLLDYESDMVVTNEEQQDFRNITLG